MNEIGHAQISRLQELHGQIVGAMRTTVQLAIEAGEVLAEIKAALPHGEFTPWIEQNAPFDVRTAQRYMKAYRNRDRLKSDSVSYLKQLTDESQPTETGIDFSEVTARQAIRYMHNSLDEMKARLDRLIQASLLEDWDAAVQVEPLTVPRGFVERWKTIIEELTDVDVLIDIIDTTRALENVCSEFALRRARAECEST